MPSMKYFAALLLSSSLATASTNVVRTSNDTACTWPEPKLGIAEIMSNWAKVWKGNHSEYLIDHTVMPNVNLWTDRLPTGSNNSHMTTETVDIHTSAGLLEYIEASRVGFSVYGFINNFYFVDKMGTMLVARWTLNATIGEDNNSMKLKSGDQVTMNGTDILTFERCSGRISDIFTAQDILSFANQVGLVISA